MTPEERQTFDFLEQRKRAYQVAFGNPAGAAALDDLAMFCRATESCVVAARGYPLDLHRTLVVEGRREVYLRIREHLDLTTEQLFELYAQRKLTQENPNAA